MTRTGNGWTRWAACALVAAGLTTGGAFAESLKSGDDSAWKKTISVARGEEHTFWVTGLSAETGVSSLSVEGEYSYKEDGETYEDSIFPSEEAETYDGEGTLTGLYCLLTSDDWENVPTSVKSVKFTVTVDGFYDEEVKANNTFTFGHAKGRDAFPGEQKPTIPSGHPDKPLSLTVKETADPTVSCGVVDCSFDAPEEYEFDTYTVKLTLKKGRRYYLGADVLDAAAVACTGTVGRVATNLFADAKAYTDWSGCATAFTFVSPLDGPAVMTVSGGQDFALYHAVLPARTPANHSFTDLAVGETTVEFTPGRENDPESGAWDGVIDERLFRITGYKKGDALVFATDGASCDLLARLYDAKGTILAENVHRADDTQDILLAWTATANYAANSALYVGVCQKLAEDAEPDEACTVTLRAAAIALANPTTPLAAVPAAAEGDPRTAEGAVPSAARTLGEAEWANTFVLAARAGVTYHVKAQFADGGAANGNALAAEVYTLNGTRKVPLPEKANVGGDLDPAAEGWLSFTPTAHGNVYLDVTVADRPLAYGSGQGLPFGPYALVATATSASGALGILQAPMKGASTDLMGWKILSGPGVTPAKEPFYAAGAAALVPAGAYTLVAREVKEFAKPDAKGYATVDVAAGTSPSVAAVYKYTDTADPLDDCPDTKAKHPTLNRAYAPTKLAPTAARPVETARSLWKGENGAADDVDWFTFTGAEGSYYRFELSGVEGAPRMAVFGPNNWTNACAYVLERDEAKAVQVCAAKRGTYYVRVAQADETNPVDSAYTLTASMATPGVVKLAKTALTVKDSAGHADISVSRTGRDGRVRVAFRTEGAQSDRADAYYYPTNGVLEWTDGDNKAKTVRVRLAPDAAWHDARTVKLVLSAIPEEDDDFRPSGEYVAAFPVDARTGATLDTATVTVTSAAKAAPGTVQLAGADTPKRPVVDVEAGKTVTLTLERTGGADGLIAVTAATAKGTANKTAGLDYEETAETFTWKDGETDPKTLTIRTKAVEGDHTAKKTFTVKLAAKTGKDADGTAYARPTLAATSVTVNILNEKFASTMADFAKTLPKNGGVAVKEGKAGTWFVAEDGSFFASPAPADLTFTLDGPGRFTYRAAGEETNRVAYVAAGKKTVAVKGVAGIDAYTWEPLPAAAPLAPTWDKAVLRAGPATLAFAQAAGVSYRVYLLNAAERGVKLGDAATEVPAPYAIELAADAKYTWRVDSYFEGGTVTNTPKKAWALATLGADAPGTPVADGADAWGKPIAYDSASAAATNIALRVGVKAEIAVADDTATAVKSVAGTLPTGLKVEQDRASKAWFIRGVPTKAGAFEALVQATYRDEATRKAVPGTTTAFGFDVAPLGAAAGTFNGLAATSDTTNGAPRLASIALTAAATGKLSAKVQIAGKSYMFAAAGYEYAQLEADGSVRLQTELENVAKVKVGEGRAAVTVTVTNTLRCALLASATNTAAVWRDEPQVDIAFAALPDAKGAGFQEDVWYSGRIVRDGAKITDRTELAAWQAEAAAFAGYYTVSLPVAAITDAPRGSGYLTLTLDAKGKAKVAGLLADGTKYTGSSTLSLAEEDGATVARVPVFAAKATTAFGGWLTLRVGADGVPVVSASLMGDDLLWVNDEPKATREGLEGFETTLHPVGGWYDTVLNLQRAYLESDLSVSLPEGDEALEEIRELMALPEGYAFKARPDGTPVTLNGDKMEVERQKFATGKDRLKDWAASVNAANVKITFNRKTGLVNGSFDLWYEGENARGVKEQKAISGLKHNGVVLLARDPDDGTLDPDVLSSGFFLAPLKVTDTTGARPTTRTWNASYRFDINAVWSERNWQDASAGE